MGTGGLDLGALEEFCVSARANGADGYVIVGARISWRGLVRRVWVDIPAPPGSVAAVAGGASSVRVFPGQR